ncbi:IPTL-CTERM sorting domain-containing protein [Brevundimonas sp.]|uniref:IPTL-CTERM sorting domain-containing protein n=1 Tax=Brevundimonas sp. TaxID=1871086 RepID=UPI003D1494CF
MFSILLLGFGAAATSAAATPITYTVTGAYAGVGEGTFSGTFTYDATTNVYSAVNITATAGTAAPGRTYTAASPTFSGSGVLRAVENPLVVGTSRGLPIVFSAPLTNAGGSVTITGGTEGICQDAQCGTRGSPLRNIASGTVVGPAPVPTLSEWAMILFGTILAGGAALVIQRRRMTA